MTAMMALPQLECHHAKRGLSLTVVALWRVWGAHCSLWRPPCTSELLQNYQNPLPVLWHFQKWQPRVDVQLCHQWVGREGTLLAPYHTQGSDLGKHMIQPGPHLQYSLVSKSLTSLFHSRQLPLLSVQRFPLLKEKLQSIIFNMRKYFQNRPSVCRCKLIFYWATSAVIKSCSKRERTEGAGSIKNTSSGNRMVLFCPLLHTVAPRASFQDNPEA